MDASTFTVSREMIDAVADWRQRKADLRVQQPIVPLLVARFKLSAGEAISVIRAANAREAADVDAS